MQALLDMDGKTRVTPQAQAEAAAGAWFADQGHADARQQRHDYEVWFIVQAGEVEAAKLCQPRKPLRAIQHQAEIRTQQHPRAGKSFVGGQERDGGSVQFDQELVAALSQAAATAV